MVHLVPWGGYMDAIGLFPRKHDEYVVIEQVLAHPGFFGPKWLIEDPLQRFYVVDFNIDFEKPVLAHGWKSIADAYDLDETHVCILNMFAPSHFHLRVYDMYQQEISYLPSGAVKEGYGDANEEETLRQRVSLAPLEEEELSQAMALVLYDGQPSIEVPRVEPDHVNSSAIESSGSLVAGHEAKPNYVFNLTTELTPHRAYTCQFCLSGKAARFVRENGPQPWFIRGPDGVKRKINILFKPKQPYTKLGKGWRKFCKSQGVQHGQKMSMNFTDGITRLIDVEFL